MIIEIAAIAGAVGAMVAAMPTVLSEITKRRQTQQDFKSYLYTLADCLDEMVDELSNNRVPTGAGNRIEAAFEDFEKKQKKLKVEESKKDQLISANHKLKRNLADGRFLDVVIRGNILRVSEGERTRMLIDMTRTSGYLRGVADTLKSENL